MKTFEIHDVNDFEQRKEGLEQFLQKQLVKRRKDFKDHETSALKAS